MTHAAGRGGGRRRLEEAAALGGGAVGVVLRLLLVLLQGLGRRRGQRTGGVRARAPQELLLPALVGLEERAVVGVGGSNGE